MTDRLTDRQYLAFEERLRGLQPDVESGAPSRVLARVHAHIARHQPRSNWWSRLFTVAAVAVPVAAAAAIALVLAGPLNQASHDKRQPTNGNPIPSAAFTPPVVPAGTPSVASTPPVVPAACDLPVYVVDNSHMSSFLQVPAGGLTADATSKVNIIVTSSGAGTGNTVTVAQPTLKGDSMNPSYDAVVHRWVPVFYRAISPDGKSYAYAEYPTLSPGPIISQPIHVVDAATGFDRILHTGEPFDQPVWLSDGIYVTHHIKSTDTGTGLWRLDPSSGAVTQVDASGHDWTVDGHGGAWNGKVSTLDPSPPDVKDPQSAGNTAVRLDIASQTPTEWLYRPGKIVRMIGYDADSQPVITVTDSNFAQEVWLMTAPTVGRLVRAFPANGTDFYEARANGSVTWFFSQDGVYKYTSASGFELISKTGGTPGFAGPCRTGH